MTAPVGGCARPGCGQESCATVHMVNDEAGGHDFQPGTADYDVPAHDRLGRLDRSICGACGDAYVECSKCGGYFCDCSRGSEPCVTPPVGQQEVARG